MQEHLPRKLFFNERKSLTLEPSGVPKLKACIGLGGVKAPLAPSSELVDGEITIAECDLRLITTGVRKVSDQVSRDEHLRVIIDERSGTLRFPPIQLPAFNELPVHQQRSAEFESNESSPNTINAQESHMKMKLRAANTSVHTNAILRQRRQASSDSSDSVNNDDFKPLFTRDDDGNPKLANHGVSTNKSVLVALDWHPTLCRVAVALLNDSVYFFDVRKQEWSSIILCHTLQKHVSDMLFDPLSGTTVAVLAHDGLCVWRLIDAQATAWMQILQPPDWTIISHREASATNTTIAHTRLCFSPCARYVAFTSSTQFSIAVYDLFLGTKGHTALYTRGYVISNICWARNGQYLVASVSNCARYLAWDTATWTLSSWTLPVAPVQQFAFHHMYNIVLIAEIGSGTISSVSLSPIESECRLDVSADTSTPFTGNGGNVRLLCWSPSSERLAISFEDDDEDGCELIALLSTHTNSGELPRFSPIGYIRGPPARTSTRRQRPLCMAFRPHVEYGALLCVAWTQGQLTFYPLLYN